MSNNKSIWNKASDFLALTRKILLNSVTALDSSCADLFNLRCG